MVNPMIIAAGISAAGSIGSQLLAGGSKGSGTANRKASRGQIRGTVQGAREAGLHPLAVLGGGTGGGFAQPVNPMGQAIAQASSDVAQGVIGVANMERGDRATSQQNALALVNSASNRQLQAAQSDYWRAKTLTEVQSASQLNTVRNSPGLRVSGVPDTEKRRYEIELYDRKGNFMGYIPDPDIMEGLEGTIPAALTAGSYFNSPDSPGGNSKSRRSSGPRRPSTFKRRQPAKRRASRPHKAYPRR